MQVYIEIDWSENKHDIVMMNEAGAVLVRQTIAHTPEGFLELEASCQSLSLPPDACLFGLETAHNMVIDFLWSRSYTNVYVIPPSVVKSIRGRCGQSGARTDQSDALLLADLLRTDRARLQVWHPDSLLTRQMRAKVSLINHLTRSTVRLSNRLRAVWCAAIVRLCTCSVT
jgi:transposase